MWRLCSCALLGALLLFAHQPAYGFRCVASADGDKDGVCARTTRQRCIDTASFDACVIARWAVCKKCGVSDRLASEGPRGARQHSSQASPFALLRNEAL